MRVHRLVLNLAITAFAAAGLLAIGSSAAQAQVSGLGCFGDPTEAASAYVFDWNDTFGEDASLADQKVCKKLCKDLQKGCQGAASSANSCVSSAIKSFAKSAKDLCKEDSDPKTCKQDVKDEEKAEKDNLKTDKKDAKENCKSAKSICDGLCGLS